MRAIVLDDRVTVQDSRPSPNPGNDEVLVRVTCAGICETDLQLIKGYMGFRGVLGHEFVGVAESGPMAGRRVVGEINCACWTCETCRRGLHTHCPNRTVIGILNHDGAFADLIAVPQRNLHAVPDSLSDEIAVFTEPVAAAFQIPAQISIRCTGPHHRPRRRPSRQSVRAGARAVVESRDRRWQAPRRSWPCWQSLGIATAHLSDPIDERSADIVVDCTGSETGLPTALRLVRPRGRSC